MMRRTTFILVVTVLAIVWLAPSVVAQKPKSQMASGGFLLGLSGPGTATCIGGMPTGWFPPCDPWTKRTLWRDFGGVLAFQAVTGDAGPYFTGTWALVGHCNLDENLAGPCWGTFRGTALDGSWEGTWNGKLDFGRFGADLNFVGHGSGGTVDGLHMKLEAFGEGSGSPYEPVPFTARVFTIRE